MSRKFYLFLSTLIILTIFIPLCVSAGTQPGRKQPSHPISEITQGTFQVGVYELSSETALNGSGIISLLSTSKDKSIFGQGAQFGVEGVGSRIGVYGHSLSGYGVHGFSNSSYGVYGHSLSGYGVHGFSDSSYGVYGRTISGYAVVGNVSPGGLGYSGYFTGGQGVRIENGELYVGGKAVVAEQLGVRRQPRTAYALDVYGNVSIVYSGATITLQTTDTNWPSLDLKNSAGEIKGTIGYSVSRDQVYFGYGANTQQFVISNTGNIGIGTGTPSSILHVKGSGATITLQTTDTNWPSLDLKNSAGEIKGTIGYSVSRDQVYFGYGANTQQFVISNTGNIGIGTTDPAYKLDVSGALRLQPSSQPTADNGVIYYDSSLKKFRCYQNGVWVDCIGVSGSARTSYLPLWTGPNTLGSSIVYQAGENIGIGTTAPFRKLHVAGGDAVIGYMSTSSGGVYITQSATYGQPAIQGVTPTFDAGTLAINPVGGNVGIGTAGPTAMLTVGPNPQSIFNANELFQIAKTGDAYMTIRDGTGVALLGTTGGIPFVGSQNNVPFTIRTNNAERIRIDSSGNVGIGTTAPSGKLQVSNHIYATVEIVYGWQTPRCQCDLRNTTIDCPSSFETSDPTGSICYDQFKIDTTRASIKFEAKDDASLFVSRNGNVGIGTTAPGAKLDVKGDIHVAGKVKFGYEVVTATAENGVPIAYCPSGKKVLGGGCWQSPYAAIRTSGPVDPDTGGRIEGWSCRFIESRQATAYAICANVDY